MTTSKDNKQKTIFNFNEAEFDKNEVEALKIMQDPEKLKSLVIKAESFELIKFFESNATTLFKTYIENKTAEFEKEIKNDTTLKEIADRTSNPASTLKTLTADTLTKQIADFKLTIPPKFQQYLPETKPKRKNKPKNDFIVITIDKVEYGFAGGAHIKTEIVDYFYNKVKNLKTVEAKLEALFKEVDKVKVAEYAEKSKIKSFVHSILSIKTIRFKCGKFESNCRGVIYKELTESIIEKLKDKDVTLDKFYVENDYDKAFPNARKLAFENMEKDIKKRKVAKNIENF